MSGRPDDRFPGLLLVAESAREDLRRPVLLRQPGKGGDGWAEMIVVLRYRRERRGIGRKRFWLGHNGERWAQGTDWRYLREHFPDVLQWAHDEIARQD